MDVYIINPYAPAFVTADPLWGSLLHFNGADNSTTFTDETGKIWTAQGNARLETTDPKLGSAAGFFDGTNDFLTTPDVDDWDLSDTPFTIEAFINLDGNLTSRAICSHGISGSTGYHFNVNNVNVLTFNFRNTIGGNWVNLTGSTPIATGSWRHVAVSSDGTTVRVFLDGTQDASGTGSGTRSVGSDPIIGRTGPGETGADFNGRMDEFRLTRVYQYPSNFTPTTTEFTYP